MQLFTEAANSPAIYAKGDVSVAYGISEQAFWGLFDILENNQVGLESWEARFTEQVERFRTLGKELDVRARYDPIAAQAKEKLDKGDIPGAENILTADVFGLNKQTAYRNYEAALVRELALKYADTTTTLFRNAAMLDENNPEYSLAYGNNLHQTAQYDEAIEQFEQSIKWLENAENVDSSTIAVRYNNLGLAYDSKGEYDRAISYLENALSILYDFFPNGHPYIASTLVGIKLAYYNRGMYDYQAGQYRQALSFFEKGLRASESAGDTAFSVTFLNSMGSCMKHLNQCDSALVFLNKGIETAEYLEQELMKQVEMLPDSIRQSPEFPALLAQYSQKAVLKRLYFHKAGCLHRVGQKQETRLIFDRLKQEALEPKDEKLLKEIAEEGY